ncbi:30S ribosomal protein S19e [Candidatus Bathyarchaeota archaeon]|nr:30S ribosomal protein S19e [Candidatus Bathyarchaeota archaeon]MBS7613442.1 30S ribosomal protein S19e [Candidatus Bathyarchaeota archaeon]MBS7617682.1 30S ribosomal protein S19e [Candidatus Bathyarchaeota archaeon]
MVTVYDVPADVLIKRLAEELKENFPDITPPMWVMFVKTGCFKERIPVDLDWWYVRAASILRKLYVKGPLGVSRLATEYGGRKRGKRKPPHFRKAGRNHIRKILQQLEKSGLIHKVDRRGRILTSKGVSFLDSLAADVLKKYRSSVASSA